MTRWKRLFYYLLINVLVSACTVWTVLSIWEWRNPEFQGVLPSFLFGKATTVPEEQVQLPTSEPVVEAAPSSGPTEEVFIPAMVDPSVENSKVAISNIFGMGVLDTERVRIAYSGTEKVSLAGWELKDEDRNIFSFPDLTLYPNGTVEVHTASGVDDVTTLFWGVDDPVWSSGEQATLLDGEGLIISTFVVP